MRTSQLSSIIINVAKIFLLHFIFAFMNTHVNMIFILDTFEYELHKLLAMVVLGVPFFFHWIWKNFYCNTFFIPFLDRLSTVEGYENQQIDQSISFARVYSHLGCNANARHIRRNLCFVIFRLAFAAYCAHVCSVYRLCSGSSINIVFAYSLSFKNKHPSNEEEEWNYSDETKKSKLMKWRRKNNRV